MTSWCSHCSDHHPPSESPNGFSSCGRILSHLQTPPPILHTIAAALNLDLSQQPTILSSAHKLFSLAQSSANPPLPKTNSQIAAVCLYIALHHHRRHNEPTIMLIHLSYHLNTTHYSLAAILLLLCQKTFNIKHLGRFAHRDPSLFMHRLSSRLLGRPDSDVATTALRIIAEYTGGGSNPPNRSLVGGFCNAALYLAASANGHVLSKMEVVCAVSVELERMKRSASGDGGMTVEEFVSRAGKKKRSDSKSSVCGHEGSGLCRQCYEVFVEMSGVGRRSKKEEEDCIDDVDMYINSEKVREYRRLIWEEMNRDYTEEQLAKEIARASRGKKQKGGDRGSSGGVGRGATKKVEMKKKVLSSRVNYDVLSKLIGDEEWKRIEMDTGVNDEEHNNNGEKEEEERKEFDEGTEENYNDKEDEVYEGFDFGGEGEKYNDYFDYGNEDYVDDDFGF